MHFTPGGLSPGRFLKVIWMEQYDLIIRGGRVMDPASGTDGLMDVGVKEGKIVGMGDLSACSAAAQVDASGCLVTPGLIDMHAHIAPLSAIGIPADAACLPGCVTTVGDGGSTGCANYPLLRPGLMGLIVTPKIFLHVSSAGLAGFRALQENIDPACFDRAGIMRLVEKYPEEIVGLKIRIGTETTGALGLSPLKAAREIAGEIGLPLMVHCTNPPAPMAEVLSCLEKGDILTHAYHGVGHTLLEEGGFAALRKARQRGVYMDVGDACKHISFPVMRRALEEGLGPDSISSDSTDRGYFNPQGSFSLLFCVSKWLNLGMPLMEAVACVTSHPAREMGIGHSAGALSPGRDADIAVMRLEEKKTRFFDGAGETLEGSQLLRPMMTVKAGKVAFRDLMF